MPVQVNALVHAGSGAQKPADRAVLPVSVPPCVVSRARWHACTCALALVVGACSGASKPKSPPKPELPALETASLAALAQGPGAQHAIVVAPRAIFAGPLAAPVGKLVPSAGLDRLAAKLGFDLRKSESAMLVSYAATTVWAARLPEGTAPSSPLDAFEKRILPPTSRATPRPDLVRVQGSLPGGDKASAAGFWSTQGDVVVGESGRLGPVVVAMALATKKLAPERALAADKTFAPLLAWSKGAEIAAIGRCPLGVRVDKASDDSAPNLLLEECFGAGVTLRPLPGGKLAVSVRVTGHWGKDAELAADAMRSTIDRVTESDLGRVLGLRDAPKAKVVGAEDAVSAEIVVDADTLASGLGRLLEQEIGTATK